jgi:hypothetical protein
MSTSQSQYRIRVCTLEVVYTLEATRIENGYGSGVILFQVVGTGIKREWQCRGGMYCYVRKSHKGSPPGCSAPSVR